MKPIPHKSPRAPLRIIALDTEDDSNGNVISYAFCWHNAKGKVERFFTKDNRLARVWLRKQPRSLIVAHNLEYDLVNLYRDVGFYEIEEMSYTARLVSAKIKDRGHRFIDSFNFFPSSLEKMGDIIGLEKLPFDPNSQEYAERDPEIVLESVHKFRSKLLKEFDVDLTNTIGSLAMKIFLEKYLKEEFRPFNDQIALDAFYGGRCEVFYRGPVEGDIWEADINSEYPTVMCEEFPNTNTIRKVKNLNYRFGVALCTVKAPKHLKVPVLPLKIDGKLCFPVGEFKGSWTFAELKAAKKRGYKILKVHDAYGTNDGCRPFKQYMEELYALRLDSEDELAKLFYKLLMNNLYGRLIQHNSRCILTHGEMDLFQQEELSAILKSVYGDIHIYEVPMLEPPPAANYLWGAYVTSYGRLLLLEQLEKVEKTEGCILLYCDTDSVMSLGVKPDLDYDEKRLGALKAEKWDSGKFVMPKGYYLSRKGKNKVTCKGIPQPAIIREKNLEMTLENPRMAFLELGRASFQKPVKLRQSFPQHKKPNVWETHNKKRLTNRPKRIELGDGPTSPLVLEPEKF